MRRTSRIPRCLTLNSLRLGFAWSSRGKTLLRGGAALFDVLPLPYGFTLLIPGVFPYTQEVFANVLPPGSFPTGAFEVVSADPAKCARANYIEQSPKRNYVMQWNLSVAQELSPSLVATLGYVGSRGVHQPFRMDDLNMVLPTLTPAGYLFPPPATSERLNPNFGRVDAMLWQANSFYDALEADITKKGSEIARAMATHDGARSEGGDRQNCNQGVQHEGGYLRKGQHHV